MNANIKKGSNKNRRPVLRAGMSPAEFSEFYWMKADLVAFARSLGVATHGYKPELSARIERVLAGKPAKREQTRTQSIGPRDSDRPLRRNTPVVNYKSDDKTRAFFKSHIGPDFHFTYYLNQYRLQHRGLTYGDLIAEWLAERDRRRRGYKPEIADYGKWNQYVRDFFADQRNKGKSLADAATSWNAIKGTRGDQSYAPKLRGAVKSGRKT